MAKTRKVQVTLEEAQYEDLERIAAREGKKLAAVVRESIERYCLGPESERSKREALKRLFAASAPVPEEYGAWEDEYARLKTKGRGSKPESPQA
jgi:predicted DNA-binding protein